MNQGQRGGAFSRGRQDDGFFSQKLYFELLGIISNLWSWCVNLKKQVNIYCKLRALSKNKCHIPQFYYH